MSLKFNQLLVCYSNQLCDCATIALTYVADRTPSGIICGWLGVYVCLVMDLRYFPVPMAVEHKDENSM